jgi:phosphoglycolate phosphatase-like HAD superfamily hydrolase
VTEYVERFNVIVNAKINAFQVEPDALARLQELARMHALYINSNTPDEPLHASLEKLGIAPLFKGIYGSSVSKKESLRTIAARESVGSAEIVFVGDGEGDREAAEACGSRFIGVATSSNGWTAQTMPYPVVASIADITDEQLSV